MATGGNNGNARRQWLAAAASAAATVAIAIFGAIWWLNTLGGSVQNNKAEMEREIAQQQAVNQSLMNRLNRMDIAQQAMEVQQGRMEERMTEIGSQLHAMDEIHALSRADDLRFRGLVWPKLFGQPYPEDAYFPHIEKDK